MKKSSSPLGTRHLKAACSCECSVAVHDERGVFLQMADIILVGYVNLVGSLGESK